MLARKPNLWRVWPPFSEKTDDRQEVSIISAEDHLILEGFAVPLYDFWDTSGNSTGGFEGWVIVQVDGDQGASNPHRTPRGNAQDASQQKDCQQLINLKTRAFNAALQKFALQVSDERMRELEEKDWRNATSPERFAYENYGGYGGWRAVEDEVTRSEIAACMSSKRGPFVEFGIWSKDATSPDPKWTPAEDTTSTDNISHLAIRLPLDRRTHQRSDSESLIFVFKRRRDTILPKKPKTDGRKKKRRGLASRRARNSRRRGERKRS